jgi:hypothetical protein
MARFTEVSFIAAALSLAAVVPNAGAQALTSQPEQKPKPASATSPVLAPKTDERAPRPSTSGRVRPISSGVAAALAAASPKFTPPPPKPEPKPEEELVDMREIDKPKNGIIRLPKYTVQEAKPPVFREREINTKKGLTDIAMRRYISDADRALNKFTLPLFGTSKESRALAMYAEEERLKNMSDLADAANNASKSDAAAGAYNKREAQKTYLRSSDFGWSSGEPR